ncbi:unnamed protein product [Penicillium salamii]|uniref:C2H2-type domain-containing protein n=1 Tax=Penicillium salamii TaxID=1612424 RepID=A0A9W4NQK7_9EURO|nr:unnamed protein product [Penicillium salamii]
MWRHFCAPTLLHKHSMSCNYSEDTWDNPVAPNSNAGFCSDDFTLPIDFAAIDPIFDPNVFHNNPTNYQGMLDLNTMRPVESEQGFESTDSFFMSPPAEGFTDFLNSPHPLGHPPPTHNEGEYGSSYSTMETLSNRLGSLPALSTSGLELTSEHGNLPGHEMNLQQIPVRSSSSQRGLPRRRSRYFTPRPNNNTDHMYDPSTSGLNPMQRWQHQSEDEPASVTAIMDAMKQTPTVHRTDQSRRGRNHSASRSRRSVSTTSRESSASSAASSSHTRNSSHVRKRQSQPRSTQAKPYNNKPRIFCCTFCCDRFGSRYEWVRHEKSLHLHLESWSCAPFGPSVLSAVTGKQICAFCELAEPTEEHLSGHSYEACQGLSNEFRSFHRKDHLVQHIRHVHNVQKVPPIDDWKIEVKDVISRCGFCDTTLENWDDRVSHLAKHYHKGSTMKDWKGDHGFAPHIAAQLKNAYPPYLLGWESECIVPFSATSKDAHDQYTTLLSGARMTEEKESEEGPPDIESNDQTEPQLPGFLNVFTRHLGQYARTQIELGIVPTDEMFQKEARKALFDSEDAWDQTIADNPEWLSAFRQLHVTSAERQ